MFAMKRLSFWSPNVASLAVVDLERGASPSVVSSPGLVEDSVAHAQPGALAAFFKRFTFAP